MTDMKNPYGRSIDPENDSMGLWVIVTALLLILLTSGFLYTTMRSVSHGVVSTQQAALR